MSEYIAKASIEPRDYRVVFLIQKNREVIPPCFANSERMSIFCDISLHSTYSDILPSPDRSE